MNKITKILLAALAVTVFCAIVGAVTCGGVFNWVYQLEPTNVWQPMEGAPPMAYFLGLFLLNIIFAIVYALLHKGLPGDKNVIKGLVYGLVIWAVGMLPGMFATYIFMTVAPTVVVYWTIMGLITYPLEGLIVALIYGNEG